MTGTWHEHDGQIFCHLLYIFVHLSLLSFAAILPFLYIVLYIFCTSCRRARTHRIDRWLWNECGRRLYRCMYIVGLSMSLILYMYISWTWCGLNDMCMAGMFLCIYEWHHKSVGSDGMAAGRQHWSILTCYLPHHRRYKCLSCAILYRAASRISLDLQAVVAGMAGGGWLHLLVIWHGIFCCQITRTRIWRSDIWWRSSYIYLTTTIWWCWWSPSFWALLPVLVHFCRCDDVMMEMSGRDERRSMLSMSGGLGVAPPRALLVVGWCWWNLTWIFQCLVHRRDR